MAQSELNCKELVEIITSYLEGTLPPASGPGSTNT
jgi:hypothetical protein